MAVSGGSDSMAALHLMARLAPEIGWQVEAVTVDHGLRPEALEEAEFVAATCARLNVPHAILRWARSAKTGNLQDQARRARYRLMTDWAQSREIADMAVAHTADDQAETFLMRLAREAGIDGLAEMRQRWKDGAVEWHRPFLYARRGDMRAYLQRQGISWIEDPSNLNTRFARVRVREALALLEPLGISKSVLSEVSSHLRDVQTALDRYCQQVAQQIAVQQSGDLVFNWLGLLRADHEVTRRLLIAGIRWVSGARYAPRASAVGSIQLSITDRQDKTLSGCRIVYKGDTLRILREARALRDASCPSDAIWDNRWQLSGPHAPDLTIRALGANGLLSCPDWRSTGFPRASLLASPAVWRGDTLIAAPLAGVNDAWQARIVADFHSSLVSH